MSVNSYIFIVRTRRNDIYSCWFLGRNKETLNGGNVFLRDGFISVTECCLRTSADLKVNGLYVCYGAEYRGLLTPSAKVIGGLTVFCLLGNMTCNTVHAFMPEFFQNGDVICDWYADYMSSLAEYADTASCKLLSEDSLVSVADGVRVSLGTYISDFCGVDTFIDEVVSGYMFSGDSGRLPVGDCAVAATSAEVFVDDLLSTDSESSVVANAAMEFADLPSVAHDKPVSNKSSTVSVLSLNTSEFSLPVRVLSFCSLVLLGVSFVSCVLNLIGRGRMYLKDLLR